MAEDRPNILFIMTDHQRADDLGTIQAGVEVTPNLNRLAARAAVFTRAYTTCPLCVPARTALATGKYPTKNGVVFNDWQGARAGDHKPIHQSLAELGYDMGHVGVDHIRVKPALQDRLRFARWVEGAHYYRGYAEQHGIAIGRPQEFCREVAEECAGGMKTSKYTNTKTAIWPYPEEHHIDGYFARESVDFLTRRRDKPFALFVYFWSPHPPLRVPAPHADLFDPEHLTLPDNVGVPAAGEPPHRRRCVAAQLAEGVTPEEWRKVWAAHLGLVHMVDGLIGQVLDALEDSGQAEKTVVVFSADHGDHLGQHGMYQKMELYEQALRVPLIFKVPETMARTIDAPVSHLDVLPTLLQLTGADAPADLDGMSLLPALDSGLLPGVRNVYSQYSGNPSVGDLRRAVVTERYKYVFDPNDAPELYDLLKDPLETVNLACKGGLYDGVCRDLHNACKDWAESHGDWVKFDSYGS